MPSDCALIRELLSPTLHSGEAELMATAQLLAHPGFRKLMKRVVSEGQPKEPPPRAKPKGKPLIC